MEELELYETREEAEAACGKDETVAIDAPTGKWCVVKKSPVMPEQVS